MNDHSNVETVVTEKNIGELRECVKRLCEKVSYFKEEDFEIEVGNEEIYVPLPGDDGESFTVDEFLAFDWELDGLVITDNGRIHTKTLTYQVVRAETEDLEFYLKSTYDFYQEVDGATLQIIEAPIYVAIACLILGSYDKDFGTGHSNYTVIEIAYQDKRHKLSYDEESGLIYSYLFEIADTAGFAFYLSKIYVIDPELNEKLEELFSRPTQTDAGEADIRLRPLINFTEPMRLYISALQTTDKELKLLNFYKIFEYFAPIVISIDSYEQLSKKLDSPSVLNPNREYLESIFALVNSTNQRLRDSELIKSVFNRCFDLVELFNELPLSIQEKVFETIKEKTISYELSRDKLLKASSALASVTYSTRNQVAHAKSNFTPTGDECPYGDIEKLNVFLQKATARTIRWYEKLPEYQKR